jgi:hypothetical protein
MVCLRPQGIQQFWSFVEGKPQEKSKKAYRQFNLSGARGRDILTNLAP